MHQGNDAGIAKILPADGPFVDAATTHTVLHAGMGIVIGPRHVLTCAHVINAAFRRPLESIEHVERPVKIGFPLSESKKPVEANIVVWRPMNTGPAGDIAILELSVDVPSDVGVATFAIDGDAVGGESLTAFGCRAGSDTGLHVQAMLMGHTDPETAQIDGVRFTGGFIEEGYSGAAVWDKTRGAVVGMVSAKHKSTSDRVAFMIPVATLRKAWPHLNIKAKAGDPEPIAAKNETPPPFSQEKRSLFQALLVREKTKNFVGRKFAFDFFDQFLAKNASGHIIVEGMPGIGKSSLLAEFVRRSDSPAHFNVRADGIVQAAQLIENIHAQLCERFELDRTLPENFARDGRHIENLLVESASCLSPHERLVVVVDALDEAEPPSVVGANTLFLPRSLPSGVFLLLSRRSHTAVLEVEGDVDILDLMAHAADNRSDAEQFIRAALEKPGVRELLGNTAEFNTLIDSLLDRSENNFMYLHYVLKDIEQGRLRDGELHDLPLGLQGYYERHWQKMTVGRPEDRPRFRTIYALAELKRPVTASLLASCIGEEELVLHRFLDEWAQFLEIGKSAELVGQRPVSVYSLYHKSFADFLMEKGTIRAAKVDLGDLRQRIGDGLLSGFDLRD